MSLSGGENSELRFEGVLTLIAISPPEMYLIGGMYEADQLTR